VIKILSWATAMFLFMFSVSAKAEHSGIVLKPNNFILLDGVIDEQSSSEFIAKVLTSNSNQIVIYINSPGGSVTSGMKMIQAVKDLKKINKNVRTTCYVDFAASMAFALTQTICDERLLGQASVLMQHQATFGVQGRTGEVVSRLEMINAILSTMNKAEAKRLKISEEKLNKLTKDEWWLVGDDAISNNAADSLVPVTCSKELVEANRNKVISVFGFKVQLTFSACPLIEYPSKIEISRQNISEEDKARIEKKIYESIESRKKVFTVLP
jgi:ATP-dependent Clp protease protease subunit